MENADEPVGEGSEGAVAGVAAGAMCVVGCSCAGTGGERGERLQVAGVSESSVAGVAGDHDVVLAGCLV